MSTGLIIIICGILLQITGTTSRIYQNTKAKVEQFQAARAAFESMTRKISQATLNTYWDYDNPNAVNSSASAPSKYIRQSELRFYCGETAAAAPGERKFVTKGIFFHAPLGYVGYAERTSASIPDYRGMPSLLNLCGYFVEYGDDSEFRPAMLPDPGISKRYRFRLMEIANISQALQTYSLTSDKTPQYTQKEWFSRVITMPKNSSRPVSVLADNVIALLAVPKLSKADEERRAAAGQKALCTNFEYDTTYFPAIAYPDPEINPSNQLPPVVQVTMVAVDEASGARLVDNGNPASVPDLFSGLFTKTNLLLDDPNTPAPQDGDLSKLGAKLVERGMNYRVFTTNVAIKAARWSREQN